MAVYDREQQRIVLRIVYDGPARAGKTTNVKQLSEFFTHRRRSDVLVPEELEGRTMFFDWMQLDGGLVAGETLRCQFVTVPGQRRLAARRKHILETADVVVFVCSSAARSLPAARGTLDTLRWTLRGVGRQDVPLVVQANKQDLKTAVSLPAVRAALNLPDEIQLLGGTANTGGGVRETAVLAIRAAAKAVEAFLFEHGIDALLGRAESADELLSNIRQSVPDVPTVGELMQEFREDDDDDDDGEELEEKPSVAFVVDVKTLPPPALNFQIAVLTEPEAEVAPVHESPQTLAAEPQPEAPTMSSAASAAPEEERDAPPVVAQPSPSPPPSPPASPPPVVMEAPVASATPEKQVAEQPRLDPPRPADDMPSGCVWPSTLGRQVLRALMSETWTLRPELAGQPGTNDGSGAVDVLIYQAGQWCAKTSGRRQFPTSDEGRTALLNLARRKILLGELLIPNTVVALQQAASGSAWLWTLTPWMTTLRAEMIRADTQGDEQALGAALRKFGDAAVAALVLAARRSVVLDVHPSNFGSVDQALFYLDDDINDGSALPAIGHALLQRVEEYAERPEAVSGYLMRVHEQMQTRLSPSEARALGLSESIASAITRHPRATDAKDQLITVIRTYERRRDS
jgi:signal recognition particle receptor subunit beta